MFELLIEYLDFQFIKLLALLFIAVTFIVAGGVSVCLQFNTLQTLGAGGVGVGGRSFLQLVIKIDT